VCGHHKGKGNLNINYEHIDFKRASF